MKRQRRSRQIVAAVLALGLVAAACGDDDDAADDAADAVDDAVDDAGDAVDDAGDAVDDAADDATDEMTGDTGGGEIDLASVCPSPLVIQTDWFPESEHGSLYQMVGDGYSVDSEQLTVTGPLWAPGQVDTGIEIEVRTGGPAIGFNAPRVNMYTDESIHIGYSNLDAQVIAWEATPLIAVMAPLEINPQIIMWDPEAYPEVETIADLGEEGITVNIFGGGGFSDVFVAQGIWSADQVDPSYDGSPARFIAEGNIAQQGFASAEPYKYENDFEDFGRPVAFQLLHDAGYPIYSQTLSVIPDNLEELRPCLEQVIPIVQQSVIDFAADPARANAIIIDAVGQFDSFWVYDEGVAEYAVATMSELGLHGNGPDDTVGNMDEERVQTVIELVREAGLDVPDDLTASDMFTNEFIDESIGF